MDIEDKLVDDSHVFFFVWVDGASKALEIFYFTLIFRAYIILKALYAGLGSCS